MARYKSFIDNKRITLAESLRDIAKDYDSLSIATGYWDLPGTLEIIEQIKDYKKIRLLIGKEPLAHRLQQKYNIDPNAPENLFPDADIKHDLTSVSQEGEIESLRNTAKQLAIMIKEKRLEIKIFREPVLHAKTYIFGDLGDGDSVGIIGSSNFTRAGMTRNSELNFLTEDFRIVEFEPRNENQENGHISWFNELWENEAAIDWTGEFQKILGKSPVGDMTFGPYEVYIKTLMEVFPEELVKTEPFTDDIEEYLHEFQNENGLDLMRKLKVNGVAMLSDSVGLGKTVTASAIVDQYIKLGSDNIMLILPAALKKQWIDELKGAPWNYELNRDYRIVSQQNISAINEVIENASTNRSSSNEIDLFIIDEAHNLRNQNSERYSAVLKLLQNNPNAHVLLLTATPINNSLMDFSYQVQLGMKGEMSSRNVMYKARGANKTERIDFFDALRRIQSEATREEKKGKTFDWQYYKNTIVSGLRNYVVRSTRQGVIKRESIKGIKSNNIFPNSEVTQFIYKYNLNDRKFINNQIESNVDLIYEGINPQNIDLDLMEDITQRSQHPIDIIKHIKNLQENNKYNQIKNFYNVSTDKALKPILNQNRQNNYSIIQMLYRLINLIGFVPYKLDTYSYKYHNQSIESIRALRETGTERNRLGLQFSIHNMLHVTWLKRLESSTATLLKSIQYYRRRLEKFEHWLERGYLVSLVDASRLATEYEEDIDQAFDDYDQYVRELDQAILEGTEDDVKKKGVERRIANDKIFNINQIKTDLSRDKQILSEIEKILIYLTSEKRDAKLQAFADNLVDVINKKEYGSKVLIFSFFSDTIDYLEKALPEIIGRKIENFQERSSFISGNKVNKVETARLFSPKSQKYKLNEKEKEIDFLFATDVLSEGQNLQDAGILVNYDLHWNPVRMIQRNGRINRLGSKFDNILVANAQPHDDLEEYLKLVKRLENKIAAINYTVGNDQSVLGEKENPIEFNERIQESYGIYSTNNEKASETMQKIENEGDILDWIDNYSLELRYFINQNSEEYIEYINDVPLGKWNYLPRNTDKHYDTTNIIGLYKSVIENSPTEYPIQDVTFVSINKDMDKGPFSSLKAMHLSEEEALSRIRTTPDDNKRQLDTIDVERKKYMDTGKNEAYVNLIQSKTKYEIKPAAERALHVLSDYSQYENLIQIITNGINKTNLKKEFESIIRVINKEANQRKQLRLSTVNRFNNLIERLVANSNEADVVKEIEGVLFYAYPDKNK